MNIIYYEKSGRILLSCRTFTNSILSHGGDKASGFLLLKVCLNHSIDEI